jgi:hypothetical protein
MAVLALNGATLVRDPGIVAGWCYAVMGAQGLVATRRVDANIVIEIAERGGQAVGTMFEGHPA